MENQEYPINLSKIFTFSEPYEMEASEIQEGAPLLVKHDFWYLKGIMVEKFNKTKITKNVKKYEDKNEIENNASEKNDSGDNNDDKKNNDEDEDSESIDSYEYANYRNRSTEISETKISNKKGQKTNIKNANKPIETNNNNVDENNDNEEDASESKDSDEFTNSEDKSNEISETKISDKKKHKPNVANKQIGTIGDDITPENNKETMNKRSVKIKKLNKNLDDKNLKENYVKSRNSDETNRNDLLFTKITAEIEYELRSMFSFLS